MPAPRNQQKSPEAAVIEAYVHQMMDGEIAHDFKHIMRVKALALEIAQKEGFASLALVEAAALMHDIGLKTASPRSAHGEVGAQMAQEFFCQNKIFNDDGIAMVCNAIRFHCTQKGVGELLFIVRDADILDLLGAHGIMRAFMSKWNKPDYFPEAIKGQTWGASAGDFDKRFASGEGIGPAIVDQINFQISCADNLKTVAGKKMASERILLMRNFIKDLEKEAQCLNS